MKTFVLLFALLLDIQCFAQKQASIWYFGDKAGLDFRGIYPVELTDGLLTLDGASATISDEDGNLLFYTDGGTVWNRRHLVMPNGSGLSGLIPGFGSQTIIIPKPGIGSLYYIFTAVPDFFTDSTYTGFRYSVVDLSKDGGLGDVTGKNTLLFRNTTFRMTAVHHTNKRDIWLLAHEANNNNFRAYLISENGISPAPVTSSIGTIHSYTDVNDIDGQMKVSPDGRKLAVVLLTSRILQLFDFDNSTGLVENSHIVPNSTKAFILYGLEFSPTGNLVYFTNTDLTCSSGPQAGTSLLQLDTQSPNQDPVVVGMGKTDENIVALQLARDGRIYVANCRNPTFMGGVSYMGVINFPDRRGTACNYNDEGFHLTTGKILAQGLPNFIQSYFLFDDPIVEMPNVFTPNESDTINSRFRPIRLANINYTLLTVVNRWGEQVFRSEDVETGWDGGGMPDGVYYWFLLYDAKNGKSGTMRGWVEIRR